MTIDPPQAERIEEFYLSKASRLEPPGIATGSSDRVERTHQEEYNQKISSKQALIGMANDD